MENQFENYEVEKQVLAEAEEILLLKAKLEVITNALSDFVYKESAATHLEVVGKGLDNNNRRGHLYTTDSEELVFILEEILSFCGVPEMAQHISRVGTGSTINNINPQELSLRCFVALRGVRSPKQRIMIQSPNVRYALSVCTDAGLNKKEAFFVLVTMVLNGFYGLSRYLRNMHPLFPLLGPLLAITSSHYDRTLFYPFSFKNEGYLLRKTVTPLRTKTLASSLLLASLETMDEERVEKLQKAFLTPCAVNLKEYAKTLQDGSLNQGKLLACAKGIPLGGYLEEHGSIKDKLKLHLKGDEYLFEEESCTVSQGMDTVYFASTWGASSTRSLALKSARTYSKQVLDAISFDVIGTSDKSLTFITNLEGMTLSNGEKLVPYATTEDLKRLSVHNMYDQALLNHRDRF